MDRNEILEIITCDENYLTENVNKFIEKVSRT